MAHTDQNSVPSALRRNGWKWTNQGLQVSMGASTVLFPPRQVIVLFDRAFTEVGVPPSVSVGACMSVGGLFKKVRRGLSKKIKGVTRSKIVRGISRAAKKVGTVAKNVVTHPAFRAGFAGLAMAVPALAPAAAGLEVASRVIKKVEDGKRAAQQIKKGIKTAKNIKAVKAARTAQKGIARVVQRAGQGDQRAKRAFGAIIGATAANRAAKRSALRAMPPAARARVGAASILLNSRGMPRDRLVQ
jgi:hypothetical protein